MTALVDEFHVSAKRIRLLLGQTDERPTLDPA